MRFLATTPDSKPDTGLIGKSRPLKKIELFPNLLGLGLFR